jgi:methylated-DNA-[protein]-cysteine S-methyltransferase
MTTIFQSQVYVLCSQIPKGKVSTYKEIAKAMKTKAYRAVGSALNSNLYAPKVPCHRVIHSNGDVGGFAHGQEQKIKLLTQEGVEIKNNKINVEKYLFTVSL